MVSQHFVSKREIDSDWDATTIGITNSFGIGSHASFIQKAWLNFTVKFYIILFYFNATLLFYLTESTQNASEFFN